MSFAPNTSSSERKRVRDDDDDEGGLDFDFLGSKPVKRARLGDERVDSGGDMGGATMDAVEDDFDPLGLGGDMGEVLDEKTKAVAREGDTSGLTLRELIRKRVVGQEPGGKSGEGVDGSRRNGDLLLPSVRGGSSRSAMMSAPVDVDPALGFYEAPSLQVRIGADGRVVLDAGSAIVQRQEELDLGPRREIQGGRTHITSATYARHPRSERWTEEDVEVLYEALSKCGTDFSMVEVFFPSRTRAHIKARFKKEERENPTRVNAALKARIPMELEEFKELLAIKKMGPAKASASASRSKNTSQRASAAPSGTHTPSGAKTPSQRPEPRRDDLDDFNLNVPALPSETKESSPKKKEDSEGKIEEREPIPTPIPLSSIHTNGSAPSSPGGFETSALNYDDID